MASRMASRAFFGRQLVHLVIFLVVGAAYWLGFLDFLEYKLIDTRFDLLRRETSGGIVLIEIDAPSLRKLGWVASGPSIQPLMPPMEIGVIHTEPQGVPSTSATRLRLLSMGKRSRMR